MLKFALVGIGYIAPRHLEAIKAVGGDLLVACDIRDSVGILDKYFPKAKFCFPEEFETELKGIDYLVICTPNQTHYEYIKMGERNGCKIICEKPLLTDITLFPNIPSDVNVIQQLRLHPDIYKIKGETINIFYQTPRGHWYSKSWKGKENLLINIGIHLFDLMYFLFGELDNHIILQSNSKEVIGKFTAGKKKVNYHLSINGNKIIRDINGVNLSNIDLHTESYRQILANKGFKKESVIKVLEFING